MKRLSRSALPPLDRTARLPLMLALALAAALALQLAATDDVTLPDGGAIGGARGRSLPPPRIVPAAGAAAIVARAMFAPGTARGSAGAATSDALGGATIVGSVRIGRLAYAVVHGPGERTANVRIGGLIGTWRLRGLSGTGALLVRDADRLTVPFGAKPTTIPAPAVEGNEP